MYFKKALLLSLLSVLAISYSAADYSKADSSPAESVTKTIKINDVDKAWEALTSALDFQPQNINKQQRTAFLQDHYRIQTSYGLKNPLYVNEYDFLLRVDAIVKNNQITLTFQPVAYGQGFQMATDTKWNSLINVKSNKPITKDNKDTIKAFNKLVNEITKNIEKQLK
jgi:hypothetical protein